VLSGAPVNYEVACDESTQSCRSERAIEARERAFGAPLCARTVCARPAASALTRFHHGRMPGLVEADLAASWKLDLGH
jgi:hypothetical protein